MGVNTNWKIDQDNQREVRSRQSSRHYQGGSTRNRSRLVANSLQASNHRKQSGATRSQEKVNNSNDGYQSYVDHELKRIRNESNLSRNSGLSSGSGAAEGQVSGSIVKILNIYTMLSCTHL